MMKITTIHRLIICGCVLLIAATTVTAKGWRGIVPLQSTCEDVKRILGVDKCQDTTYYLQEENVTISFSKYPCHEKWPYDQWNVPLGTVTSISVIPKIKPRIREFISDLTKYKQIISENNQGIVYYVNEEEGIKIESSTSGIVISITYLPTAKDNYLRCPGYKPPQYNKEGCCNSLFHSYYDIPSQKEKEILDSYAALLISEPNSRGYIIAYNGRRYRLKETQNRAECAKNYLVKKHGIRVERIIVIDGGYREELTIELWRNPDGVPVPDASPTIHPSETQKID